MKRRLWLALVSVDGVDGVDDKMRLWPGLALMLVLAPACGVGMTPTAKISEPAPAAADSESGNIFVPVLVTNLDGQPLANMIPIASRQPNAFDAPVVKGALTGKDGRASLSLPRGQYLYVRAWDPTGRMFANNYYDVMAGGGARIDELKIVMAPGAALRAALLGPDHAPVVNTSVGLMLFHPEKGAWWPGEASSDAQGRVVFPHVPAGKFTLKLKTPNGGGIEIPEVMLPPAGATDLGTLALQ